MIRSIAAHTKTSPSQIAPRTITRDLLESIRKTNPFEAGIADVLIERGVWSLEDNGVKA